MELRLISRNLVRRGSACASPAMCAYVETIKLHGMQDVLLVSLGAGQVKSRSATGRRARGD